MKKEKTTYINKGVKNLQKLDRSKTKYDDRLEEVNKALSSSSFVIDYFDNHFKVNLNGDDELSDKNIVCRTLEQMANYLLNSEESKALDKKDKNNIVIHKDIVKFKAKINKESYSINDADGNIKNIVDDDNVLYYLANNRNYVKSKNQSISQKDLQENNETSRVLNEYNNFLIYINNRLLQKPKSDWFLLSRAKAQVKDDMINVKNILDGVWGYNIKSTPSVKNVDYDIFDFTDRNTISYLLTMPQPSFEFHLDLWLVWLEFNETINKGDFTEEEKIVCYLLQHGWNYKEISEYLNIDYERVRRTIVNNIYKKIEKVGEKYDVKNLETKYKILNRKYGGENDGEI